MPKADFLMICFFRKFSKFFQHCYVLIDFKILVLSSYYFITVNIYIFHFNYCTGDIQSNVMANLFIYYEY